MARNEWTRWGRGDCEGYSLDIGYAYARFNASVVRGARRDEGGYRWTAEINGSYAKSFDSREEAMAHIEFELSIDGEQFSREYAGYKAHRHLNKFSQAIDTMRRARGSNSVNSDGRHSFQGPVLTLADACEADYLVVMKNPSRPYSVKGRGLGHSDYPDAGCTRPGRGVRVQPFQSFGRSFEPSL